MSSPTQSTGNANMRSLSTVEKEYLMPHPFIGQMLHWWPGATSQQKPIAGVCCDVSDHSININLQVSDSATNQVHSGVRWRRDPRPIPSQQVAEEGVWDFIDEGIGTYAALDAAKLRAERAKRSQDEELLAAHPKVPVDPQEDQPFKQMRSAEEANMRSSSQSQPTSHGAPYGDPVAVRSTVTKTPAEPLASPSTLLTGRESSAPAAPAEKQPKSK